MRLEWVSRWQKGIVRRSEVSAGRKKLFFFSAADRHEFIIAHHHMATVTPQVFRNLGHVDDMGMMDPEKPFVDQAVLEITEGFRHRKGLLIFQVKNGIGPDGSSSSSSGSSDGFSAS